MTKLASVLSIFTAGNAQKSTIDDFIFSVSSYMKAKIACPNGSGKPCLAAKSTTAEKSPYAILVKVPISKPWSAIA